MKKILKILGMLSIGLIGAFFITRFFLMILFLLGGFRQH